MSQLSNTSHNLTSTSPCYVYYSLGVEHSGEGINGSHLRVMESSSNELSTLVSDSAKCKQSIVNTSEISELTSERRWWAVCYRSNVKLGRFRSQIEASCVYRNSLSVDYNNARSCSREVEHSGEERNGYHSHNAKFFQWIKISCIQWGKNVNKPKTDTHAL